MKLLITGANGQLGQCLADAVASLQNASENIEAVFLDRSLLDLANPESISGVVARYAPDWLINCAAYTAVDRAEDEEELAHQVNALAVADLARQCDAQQIPILHVSTDYVFQGDAATPYLVSDPVGPIGAYGRTKAAGEALVREAAQQHIILRTAWVYSEYGNNFLKTMLRVGQSRTELNVVSDQLGSPTYAGDIAEAILKVVQTENPTWGTYHYTGSPVVGWNQFAETIFDEALQFGLLEHAVSVNAISSAEYPTKAARPAWSALDMSTIEAEFSIAPEDYRASTRKVIQKLAAANNQQ